MARAVRDVMMPEPLTIDADTTLQDAALRMRHWDVQDVLVVDGDEFHGVLTLSNVVVTAIASGRHPGSMTAGECCEPPQHTVSPGEPTSHVARFMARHRLRRLPVLDGDRLVGTIWATDLPTTSPA